MQTRKRLSKLGSAVNQIKIKFLIKILNCEISERANSAKFLKTFTRYFEDFLRIKRKSNKLHCSSVQFYAF